MPANQPPVEAIQGEARAREGEFKTLADPTGEPGRIVIGKDDPIYKAFRPSPETIAAIEKDERANAQGLAAIRDMIFGRLTHGR